MKASIFSVGILPLIGALLLSSCKQEEPSGSGIIAYQVQSINTTASVGSTQAGSGLVVDVNSNSSLTWKAGHVTISELNFEAKNDDRELEYKLSKPATIDLFKLAHEFGNIQVPPGNYTEIQFKVVLKKASPGNVFSLSGVYTDASGKQIPVEFNYNEDITLKLEVENLTVSSSQDYKGLLTLQLNKLMTYFSAADFKSATTNANGAVIISATSNAELFNKIKAGLVSFAKAEFKY